MNAAAVHAEVCAAAARLRSPIGDRPGGLLVCTPVVPSPWLSATTGADVRLKLENVQVTGSFKARGALNLMAGLDRARRERGVVAASSGNHGLGTAHAARAFGCAATVFVPTTTPPGKRAAITALGAEVLEFGADCVLTEQHARRFARAQDRTYISPYNDPQVLAGQGTVGVELLQQWPEVEVVYVAVGGGGLIAGMAGYARTVRPDIEWVACSPAASPALRECVRRGAVVDFDCSPTWSDSTHGGVEAGAITVPLCRELVHRWLDVEEAEIAAAMRGCLQHQHLLVEGAVGVAIAALLRDQDRRRHRACVVVCGGNLPWTMLQQLLATPTD